MTDPIILEKLLVQTAHQAEWSILHDAIHDGRTIHLAVMIEPYLSYILDGRKSIESRFSKHLIAPFRQVGEGDLVLLKQTGGPVVGCFEVANAEFVTLTDSERERIRIDHSEEICADDDFWRAREEKRFASLIFVRSHTALPPTPVAKSDRRGWIVLPSTRRSSSVGDQLSLV